MTPDDVRARFGWLRMTERATERMIAAIPDDQWQFAPAPGARTVAELVTHLYGEAPTVGAVVSGRLTAEDDAAQSPKTVAGRDEALELMRRAQANRDEVLAGLTEEQLARPVELPYGTFDGGTVLGFVYDEHWHHRGQLAVYLRLLGIEPPFLYDLNS